MSATSTIEREFVADAPVKASAGWLAARHVQLALLLLALAAVALSVDVLITASLRQSQRGWRGEVRKFLNVHEGLGHSAGVATILLAVAVLDSAQRRRIWPVIAGVAATGLAVLGLKLSLGRMRPHSLPGNELPTDVWETFTGFWPYLEHGSAALRSGVQSFPSGHAATAAALAVGLAWLYPRGRWLFAYLVLIAMAQRLFAEAHYLSDVLAGAAVGVLVAGSVCCCRGMVRASRIC
jgi:membrane-associated phospholipid phosphatase